MPLFDHYHVQQELDKALRPRVWLPSGGCIVLQSTEALVAIDVNSGRYTGKKSLEETAFAINMEAVEEIVRQIRLRSLGGIIVIDFIDMSKKAHREALVAKLNEALKTDRAKSRILNISEFGLVEMTRKRSHRSLERVMTGVCSCCEGRGRVPAAWRIAQQIAEDPRGDQAGPARHRDRSARCDPLHGGEPAAPGAGRVGQARGRLPGQPLLIFRQASLTEASTPARPPSSRSRLSSPATPRTPDTRP